MLGASLRKNDEQTQGVQSVKMFIKNILNINGATNYITWNRRVMCSRNECLNYNHQNTDKMNANGRINLLKAQSG